MGCKSSTENVHKENTFESPLKRRNMRLGIDSEPITETVDEEALALAASKHNTRIRLARLYLNNGSNVGDFSSMEGASEEDHDELCQHIKALIINNSTSADLKKVVSSTNSVELMDDEGNTPLHFASRYGRFDVVTILIDLGANCNARTKNGNTPLHFAIGYNHFDCAVKLKYVGGDEDALNDLKYPARKGHAGVGSFGLSALISASSIKQANIALKVCDQYSKDLILSTFEDAVGDLKSRVQYKGWSYVQDVKTEALRRKIKEKIESDEHSANWNIPAIITVDETSMEESKTQTGTSDNDVSLPQLGVFSIFGV